MPVAAAYVSIKTTDGLTLYSVVRRQSDLDYGNTFTSLPEGFVSGHWYSSGSNNYAIAGSKTVISANICAEYAFQMPSFPAGAYFVEVYVQQGANPAVTDGPPAWMIQDVLWNGTALLPSVNASGNEVVDLGATQSFNNTGQTTPLPVILIPSTSGASPAGSAPALADARLSLAVNYPWSQSFVIQNIDASSWVQIDFTVKSSQDDADSAAKIAVKLSNPGVGTDGLILLNGAAPSAGTTAADGAIAVASATSTGLSFVLNMTAKGTAVAKGTYVAEATLYTSAGKSTWFGTMRLEAQPTVRANPTTS